MLADCGVLGSLGMWFILRDLGHKQRYPASPGVQAARVASVATVA